MRAVGYFTARAITAPDSLVDIELPRPSATGRDAVAITVRSVSLRTSWIAIELTPPAPPMMRTAGAAPATGLRISMRSNRASQAVIDVSGNAAASANPSERGLCPTIRSSTR